MCYVGFYWGHQPNSKSQQFETKPSGTWTTSESLLSCHGAFRPHHLHLQKTGDQMVVILSQTESSMSHMQHLSKACTAPLGTEDLRKPLSDYTSVTASNTMRKDINTK